MTEQVIARRKWWICGLLLAATKINYMDRQTLANLSVRVTRDLQLTETQYGTIESLFGVGFAVGSLIFGFLADRFSVRHLYPAALIGWSSAGILTGFSSSYEELVACRFLLGVFEAGHWPCALITTQRLLTEQDRALGNSVLQSGAALGAILTPPAVLGIIAWTDPGESLRTAQAALTGGSMMPVIGLEPRVWPIPFFVIGLMGLFWVLAWYAIVPRGALARLTDTAESGEARPPRSVLLSTILDRRFLVLFIIVTCLNVTWQLIRAWLPKFLIQGRGYTESDALWFNSAYFVAADLGCLLSGAGVLALTRRGRSGHTSRIIVFGICTAITALTVIAGQLPAGWLLLGMLLLIAAGALGLFPCYYTFAQELTRTHMGRVSGILAAAAWLCSSPCQRWFGELADATGSFNQGMMLTGLPPLLGLIALLLLWRKQP